MRTWQGWRDSNPRMQESKSCALPLGDIPIFYLHVDAAFRRRQRMGWVKGLEPSTPGTTIRCSNQLSYTHHIQLVPRAIFDRVGRGKNAASATTLARQEGLEPPAYCLEGSCSILLSYWRMLSRHQAGLYRALPCDHCLAAGAGDGNRTHVPSLEGWCTNRCATPAGIYRSSRRSSLMKFSIFTA